MRQITFNQVATPDFGDANRLLQAGALQQQEAVKGLTDTLKGVQTDIRSRNNAALQNYINQFKTADELQSDAVRQGYQNLLGTFNNEYDAQEAAKLYDSRGDVLQKRYLESQQIKENEQDYNQKALLNPLLVAGQETQNSTTKLGLDNAMLKQKQEKLLNEYAALNPNDQAAFIKSNPEAAAILTKYSQEAEDRLLNNRATQTNIDNSKARNLREQGEFDAGANERNLKSNVANASNISFNVQNPAFSWTPKQREQTAKYGEVMQKGLNTEFVKGKGTLGDHMQSEATRLGLNSDQLQFAQNLLAIESHYNPSAFNKGSKASGIAQFIPDTAKRYGLSGKESDPYAATSAQLTMIRDLSKQFGGDTELMAMAYNYGSGNMQKLQDKYGANWKQHIPNETKDYLAKIGRINQAISSGNADGGGLIHYPQDSRNKAKGTQPKFNDTALGTLTAAANNITNFEAGMVADKAKTMSDNTINADTWLKENEGMLNGVPKTLHGLLKGERKTGTPVQIIKGVEKLTPAQQAQALQMAAASFPKGSEIVVTSKDLGNLKAHLQNAVNTLNKGDSDKANAYAFAQIDNALRTVSARDGESVDAALNAMNLDKELKQRYLESKKDKVTSPTQQAESKLQEAQQAAKKKADTERKVQVKQAEEAKIKRERDRLTQEAAAIQKRKDDEQRRLLAIAQGSGAAPSPFYVR